MSRNTVRPVKTAPATVSSPAFDEQERLALAHLEKGRYRDAVSCYKTLLKTERRSQWIAGLASAYAGRAQGLAVKGMLQEAIGLWRSRAELCGTALWEGPYAGWLVNSGRLADVIGHLSARRATAGAVPDARLNEELAALEAQLAPALLGANEAILMQLPAEALLLRQRPFALAALEAYARKDMTALEESLAGIPFRSPYRDLRSLLKALALWETDQNAARLALDRLPLDGPFEPLAAPLRALLLTGTQRLQQLAILNSSQQAMAMELLGWPHMFAPLMRALADADANLAPAALFDLVQRHARNWPAPFATGVWQWLAPWATRRGCDCPRIFGSPTSAAQECATALAVEITGDLDHAASHWSKAAAQIASSTAPDDRLRAALILRHVALSSLHLSRDGTLDQAGQELLTRSLELDHDDCDVHVRLVRYWRLAGNLKRARDQLDSGLSRFPDDVALLGEAVETALAAGAFKKAATSARRLLELDPLNPKVRSLVGNAHLSHAIKQIAANKPQAAKKEISEAASWVGAVSGQGRVHLLQAWTEPAASAERLRLAQLAASTWGGGLAAGWRLLREAQGVFGRAGMTQAVVLLREAGIDTTQVVAAADLLALAQVLTQEEPLVHKGLDPLAPWRQAIKSMASAPDFDLQANVLICEAFSRHQEHDLLEKFANAARRRWPDQPVFVYHAVAARFGKRHYIAGERDYDDLDQAHDRARQSRDLKLAMRIDALLEADDPAPDDDYSGLPDFANPAGLPNLPPALAKMQPEVFRAMIEETIKMDGIKSFLKLSKKDLGDALYQQVERECAGDKRAFVSRLIDLVVLNLTGSTGQQPPFVPSKIVKPKAPAQGQGKLFDE